MAELNNSEKLGEKELDEVSGGVKLVIAHRLAAQLSVALKKVKAKCTTKPKKIRVKTEKRARAGSDKAPEFRGEDQKWY